MTEGMAGFRFGGVAKQAADVRVTLNVRPARKVEILAVCLRFPGKRVLEILMALGPLQTLTHGPLPPTQLSGTGDSANAASQTPRIFAFRFAGCQGLELLRGSCRLRIQPCSLHSARREPSYAPPIRRIYLNS